MKRGHAKIYSPVLASLVVLKLVLDHSDHDVVTDKTSRVHNLLGCNSERSLCRDLFTQHVTSRQVADTELIPDSGSLRTLAYTTSYIHSDLFIRSMRA